MTVAVTLAHIFTLALVAWAWAFDARADRDRR